MLRILIVTPAPRSSRKGNRVTANRWATLLRKLGHRVDVAGEFKQQRRDMLIALHARKSAVSIARFAHRHADRPLIVALTGTDLYQDLRTSEAARKTLGLASRIVLLQPHGLHELDPSLHARCRVIYQSAKPLLNAPPPLKTAFEVCVSGHLRPVKDPFRAAIASRELPDDSRIRITHLGAALSNAMRNQALHEMSQNPRYTWMGEVAGWRARQILARSKLMVLSSELEGGANVISEALAANVPILASKISGSIGLLGEDYPGFFDFGDTHQLAQLLSRCECDSPFLRRLKTACRNRKSITKPALERDSWKKLIRELPH